ncbi:hypothetical protein BD410DRAFT_31662 [Rickenella mellea]|uniref:Uncharacterized protein n=1 Tax=Rickenella mellea TaxID=50990 RepID=A0A4R5XEQ6_9AGAM|nr:hypothetical protein BD410DRAFT_31662 [Rickenella mellea]
MRIHKPKCTVHFALVFSAPSLGRVFSGTIEIDRWQQSTHPEATPRRRQWNRFGPKECALFETHVQQPHHHDSEIEKVHTEHETSAEEKGKGE